MIIQEKNRRSSMTIENLEKELKEGNLKSLYLFYGDELFLLETNLKRIKKLFGETIKGINYILMDEQNIGEILSDIETPSFGYEKKLMITRNTGLFKKEGKKKNAELSKIKERLLNYLKENKEIMEQSVVLVFVEEEVEKQELYHMIEKIGVICKFEDQKPVQIMQRLKAICEAYQVEIDANTLSYLIECCGTKMQDLMNEIRKLIEYAGKEGKIQKQDIDQLCIKKLESVIFDLTDNLGKRQIKKSLEVLHNLLYDKEPLQKILITLYHHFKKLYFVKLALQEQRDVITVLNLKPNQTFLVNKYKMQAGYFKENELRAILTKIQDLDDQFKNGKIDLQVGLESILCEHCS